MWRAPAGAISRRCAPGVIAGMRWTADEIPRLLYRLSEAMNDEMDGIDRLDQQPALTQHRE